jgi:hypothetical protein
MHISTLKSIVEALGGSLTLRVDFLNGDSYAVALGAQREQPELAAAKR